MTVDPKKLIAAINPDIYCHPEVRGEVKKLSRQSKYLEAAEKAKLVESNYVDVWFTRLIHGAYTFQGIKNPIEQHNFSYDLFSQNLEPIYFWLIDKIDYEYGSSEKLVDNFIASPGSGFF